MTDDIFTQDVVLVNKAYLMERDERELKLIEALQESKIK